MKKEKGITLIALVITIIILIILVGVGIATLSGPNGVITNAEKAKQVTDIANIKEQWDLKKTELRMDNQTQDINVSGEEVKHYLPNLPQEYVGKIGIKNGNLAYDVNQIEKEEGLTLKSDYGFKVIGDEGKPYGSISKKMVNGKMILTIYATDNESDVDKIILPNGTEKKVKYEQEKILLSYNSNINIENTKKQLSQYFKNITIVQNPQEEQWEDYNIILSLNSVWGTSNSKFNLAFEKGINLLTTGNDCNTSLSIIQEYTRMGGNYKTYPILQNEVTKNINNKHHSDPGFNAITFREGTEVWGQMQVEDQTYDAIGEYISENGNRWIHSQSGLGTNMDLINSIYRLGGARSTNFEVMQNGTYDFKIIDLGGNEETLQVEVNEL